jgi:hypothetical protein
LLESAGFLDVLNSGGSAVDAALVVEESAAGAPGSPVAARALVAPLVTSRSLQGVVGLADRQSGSIVRFAEQAMSFLVLAGDEARLVDADSAKIEALRSRWGYPTSRVTFSGGESLGAGSAVKLLAAWRIALAAEAGGLMEAVTLRATKYAMERQAFGKPIGALQSIQHRLARAYALSHAVKWLARRAAWDPVDTIASASAANYAAIGMREVITSAHQVAGAIGVTDEFGITNYTARMAMLHLELGGARSHARAVGYARWGARARGGAAVATMAGVQ